MKSYTILLVTGFYLALLTKAVGAPAVTWNQGELTLTNGTRLQGQVSYNHKADVVQYRQENTIKAFSAVQVSEFKYFDNRLNTIRKFVAMAFPVKPSRMRIAFLEEFATGPLMIYRRFCHIREPIEMHNSAMIEIDETQIDNVDNFDYYVLEDGNLTALTDFTRTRWLQRQDEFAAALRRYAATLPIDPNTTLARLLLINQYNHLKLRADDLIPSKVGAMTGGL